MLWKQPISNARSKVADVTCFIWVASSVKAEICKPAFLIFCFASFMAWDEKSNPCACQPALARVMRFVPVPQPISSARPAGCFDKKSYSSGGEMPLSQGAFLVMYEKLNFKRWRILLISQRVADLLRVKITDDAPDFIASGIEVDEGGGKFKPINR